MKDATTPRECEERASLQNAEPSYNWIFFHVLEDWQPPTPQQLSHTWHNRLQVAFRGLFTLRLLDQAIQAYSKVEPECPAPF